MYAKIATFYTSDQFFDIISFEKIIFLILDVDNEFQFLARFIPCEGYDIPKRRLSDYFKGITYNLIYIYSFDRYRHPIFISRSQGIMLGNDCVENEAVLFVQLFKKGRHSLALYGYFAFKNFIIVLDLPISTFLVQYKSIYCVQKLSKRRHLNEL